MINLFKRSAKRLFVLVAITLFVVATMTTAQANVVIWLGSGAGGDTFLSCGSSAGNYTYTCNSSGCETMYNDPDGLNQASAGQMCRDLGYAD